MTRNPRPAAGSAPRSPLPSSVASGLALLDSLSDVVLAFDADGGLLTWNAAARTILGDPARGQDRRRKALYPWEVWERWRRQPGPPAPPSEGWSWQGADSTGKPIALEGRVYPLCNPAGAAIGTVLLARGVVHRREPAALPLLDLPLDDLFDSLRVGILLHGPRGQILLCNRAASELLGLSEETLIGHNSTVPAWSTVHEDGTPFPTAEHPVAVAIATRKAVRSVTIGMDRPGTGERVWVLVNADPQLGPGGEVVQVISTFMNITERKRVRDALQQRDQELTALIENAPDVIIRRDRALRYVYANRAIAQATGIPAAQYLGKTEQDLGLTGPRVTWWQGLLHEVLTSGKEQAVEFTHPTPAGLRSYHAEIVPEFGRDGRVEFVLSIARDVTALKQAEAAVRVSAQQFQAVFDNALDAIVILDDDRRYVDLNGAASALLMRPRAGILGARLDDSLLPEQQAVIGQIWDDFRGAGDYRGELRLLRADGSVRELEVAATANVLPGRHLLVVHDVTERKAVEVALRESDRQFRAVFDASLDAMLILDSGAVFLDANPAFFALTGLLPEESLGRPLPSIVPPELVEQYQRNWEVMVAGRASRGEIPLVRHDGTVRQIEFSLMPHFLPGRHLAVARDISDRRQAEERFTKAFDASPEGIVILRRKTQQILDVNESFLRMAGMAREEVIGQTTTALGLWAVPEERKALLQEFQARRSLRDYPLSFRTRAGAVRHAVLSLESIEVDREPCALAILRDVTDEEALAAARNREHMLYLASVRSLAATVDARDAYTHSHSQQVASYCRLIAAELGLTAEESETIELAGLLHDIGKIAIPDTILQKPGRLTPEEWTIMRAHAARGADILSAGNSPVLAPIVPMVRHHHERWAGGGYPDGLRGEAIPLGAAVIAVADAFDTITSARPYKVASTVAEACAEVQRSAGGHLHPAAAAALLRVIARDSAAGAPYLEAIIRGTEPGTSALPRSTLAVAETTAGPRSLTYQEQQRLAAHMQSLYAISRGFEQVADEAGLVAAGASLASTQLGAECVYLLEFQDAQGEPLSPGASDNRTVTQAEARWGWHADGQFRPFRVPRRAMAEGWQDLRSALHPIPVPDTAEVVGPDLLPLVAAYGWRSAIFLPLRAAGEAVGALFLAYQTTYRTFTGQDVELAEALSVEASRALAGFQLQRTAVDLEQQLLALEASNRALARRSRELAVITAMAGHLVLLRDVDQLCRQVVDLLAANFGYTHLGIALVEGDRLRPRAWTENYTHPPPEILVSQGIVGRVARSGQPVLLADVRADGDYVMLDGDLRAELCVPLIGQAGVLGVINIDSDTPGALGEADLQLLLTLAPQIVLALENAQLTAGHEAARPGGASST